MDSFKARQALQVGTRSYEIYAIDRVPGAQDLPFTHKILLENLLRTEDGANVTADVIAALGQWDPAVEPTQEIQFTPARVVMQDFTGVPVVVDLATMREAVEELGGDPAKIEPLAPAELVIDHSVIADFFGTADAEERNVALEYERNAERYQFLRWGQSAFEEFKVETVRPIPTPWSAPIHTRRWSTGSVFSAGASAASRPKQRCSVSRSPC